MRSFFSDFSPIEDKTPRIENAWGNTILVLPPDINSIQGLKDIFTSKEFALKQDKGPMVLALSDLFEHLTVAMLVGMPKPLPSKFIRIIIKTNNHISDDINFSPA